MARLGDICNIQSGGTPSRSNPLFWKGGTIPWVKISDIKGKYLNNVEETITDDGLKNSSAKIFPAGTILYSIFATIGEVCILDIDASTNQALAGIQIIGENIDRDYLYYYLVSLKKEASTIGRGVAQNNINIKILRDFEIPIPPLEEQRRIAAILDKVTSLIALRKQQLTKLDELVKARFVEMFGDPVQNTKHFPTIRMGEACYLKAGITTNADEIHDYSDKYSVPCYGGNGIRGYVKSHTYEGNFPLIGRQGALCGNVQFATGKFHATEHAILVTPLKGQNSIWLYYLLKYFDLNRFQTGAAQPGLAVKTLNLIEIMMPESNIQNEFAQFAAFAYKFSLTISQGLATLEIAKKALAQDCFAKEGTRR